jgi:hypothetical protein
MTTINALSRMQGSRHLSNGHWSIWVEHTTGSLLSLKDSVDSHCDYVSPRCHSSKLKFGDVWLQIGGWKGCAAPLSDFRIGVQVNPNSIQRDYMLSVNSQPMLTAKESLSIKSSDLEWRIELANQTDRPVDIEELRVFLPFNQDFGGIPQRKMYEERVITKFLPAGHGGYIQVMRPSGLGPYLLFQPLGSTGFWDVQYEKHPDYTPSNSYIGAASVYLIGGAQGMQTAPVVLPAGCSMELTWRGVWVESSEEVAKLLMDAGNPALQFLPSSCVPQDQTLKVLVNSHLPVKVECDTSLVSLESEGESKFLWQLLPKHPGEHLLTLKYGSDRFAYYRWFVSPLAEQVIQGRAEFIYRNQFLNDENDPRNSAILQWDGEAKSLVTDDPRPYVTGCCDECGLADVVFLAEKNTFWPAQKQIQRLESYVHKFLRVQLQDPETFAIKRWVTGQRWGELPDKYMLPGWREIKSTDIDRTFNYVHVANIYFALYRIGKLYELLTEMEAVDYLYWAYKTIETMYGQRDLHGLTAMTVGHMGASNFLKIRNALQEEGLVQEYEALQAFIDSTIDQFCQSDYPYGSEQSFDTSGYENIYFYTRERVGFDVKAAKANDKVARIMAAVKGDQPWWHWQGSDVRWWDFVVTGKWLSFDETTHHFLYRLHSTNFIVYRHYRDQDSITSNSCYYIFWRYISLFIRGNKCILT